MGGGKQKPKVARKAGRYGGGSFGSRLSASNSHSSAKSTEIGKNNRFGQEIGRASTLLTTPIADAAPSNNYTHAAAKASENESEQRRQGRKLGRASTLLSGSLGKANVGRKKLLGG